MPFVNTVRGCRRAMTSERGSVMSGLLQKKYGLLIVERPAAVRYPPAPSEPQGEPPMKTVLITGCSSGYGLETARHFHSRGWNVVATMRTPREGILPRSQRLRVLPLDVTKPDSIAAAIETCGPVDVLVNNAGIGLFGAFAATPIATTPRGVQPT